MCKMKYFEESGEVMIHMTRSNQFYKFEFVANSTTIFNLSNNTRDNIILNESTTIIQNTDIETIETLNNPY